jgi:hypothetical protein
MPPNDTSPGFKTALRITSLGARAGFTFSVALIVADLASQLAPPHRGGGFFGVAGGTTALSAWRMWSWIFRRVGIS